jgi:hypothetical protein
MYLRTVRVAFLEWLETPDDRGSSVRDRAGAIEPLAARGCQGVGVGRLRA